MDFDSAIKNLLRGFYILAGLVSVIWMMTVIGYDLPSAHRWGGAKIFAVGWLPILIYGAVEVVVVGQMKDSLFSLTWEILFPYIVVGIGMILFPTPLDNLMVTLGISSLSAVVAGYFLAMVGLKAAFPNTSWASATNETIIPALFVFIPGIILTVLAYRFLIQHGEIEVSAVPFLVIAALQKAWLVRKSVLNYFVGLYS